MYVGRFMLQVGLILSSVAAFAASLRIIFAYAQGTTWFWEGALAAYVGPFVFTAALYLDERRRCDELDRWIVHTANIPETGDQAGKAPDDGSAANA